MTASSPNSSAKKKPGRSRASKKSGATALPARAVAPGPRERLVETAAELFYRQGYSVTGINQIIAESGTHKASFYRYFESKEDLALAYLRMRGDYFRAFLARLIERSASIQEFADSWVKLTLREVRQERFFGCPIANFRGQVAEPDARQAELLREIINGWLGLIADFVRRVDGGASASPPRRRSDWNRQGPIPSPSLEPGAIAVQFLKIYEGSVQLYRLTGDPSYLRSMKDEMLAAARRPTSTQRT
ncbi:MAG: TetR/AcrR family transcriptional regulator [Leptospirales bacterium]|jgi:TetR/AcrR family transcriptional repressor of nem operon